MPAEIIPAQLVEEALEAVGEVADKKLGGKWWVKPLYWVSIVVVLSMPIVYYFWWVLRLPTVAKAIDIAAMVKIVEKPGVSSPVLIHPPVAIESSPPHMPSS